MMSNLCFKIFAVGALLLSGSIRAKTSEFTEDAYTMQAPQEIITITEEAAQLMDYQHIYQVATPKKPGLDVNPWNQFVAFGINQQNTLPFILVNPDWFMPIARDEQLFLLGRFFLLLKHGMKPLSMHVLPYAWIVLIMLAATLLFFALGKTKLAHQKLWVRILMVYGIVLFCNLTFLNSVQAKILRYLGECYDAKINTMVIDRTGNKDAAIKALEHFDASIKSELNKGETFWEPYANLFEGYANELKK